MPDICFFDSETLSLCDLLTAGAYAYAEHPSTDVLIWTYAFDDGPVTIWSPEWAWGNVKGNRHDPYPDDLIEHVRNGGYMVAWNSFFDRHIWNAVMTQKYGWPALSVDQVLCAQAQAEANNLPGSLQKACECLGTDIKKDARGKQLIQQLCNGDRESWDSELNETSSRMAHFRAYAADDVRSMRDAWQVTRPLMQSEWEEFHASERVNDRGVAVDADFAAAAQRYARAEAADINGEMATVTGDDLITITNHTRKARWIHDELWPDEEAQNLTKRPPKNDKERFSCDRPTRESLLDILSQPEHADLFEDDHLDRIVTFLELIEAGNGAAIYKYAKIAGQSYGGRIHGMYSFCGAGQTGRFSSRGVQTHNLIRAPVEAGNPNRAVDAIDDVLDGVPADELVDKYKLPLSRLLARLLRPTFIAPDGKLLVWGDWDQIEARVLPWLSMSPGGDAKLDLFRQKRDVYKYAAAPIYGLNPDEIDSGQRQVGKVSELALGFGGAAGAFNAMARNYGVILPASQVKQIVTTWRKTNDWCVQFWYALWDAAMAAHAHPGSWVPVGRVRYFFHPNLMRGTLICALPCGRWIVYPQFRHERVIVEDDDGTERLKWRTSYVRGIGGGFGRFDLWYGVLAENITQGTAASFLRDSLVECDDVGLPVVLHTHDELAVECDERDVDDIAAQLRDVMEYLPEWAEGLPLTASVESGPFYTK